MDSNDTFKEEGYELAEHLASDCWGGLYRAVYVPHRREVLMRRFPPGLGAHPEAWALARAEINAWARLDHPGVLQVLDWGLAEAGPFLTTEMPPGLPMTGCLGSPDAPGYEELFAGLLDAVEYARRLGVLHLGLRPGNIWVARGEEACRAQVAEFGLWYVCRQFPDVLPCDDSFLAPEQSGQGKASAASDVYSLGLLLASFVAGRQAEAERLEETPWQGPPEMVSVVSCCLAEQPLARYATAGELAEALGFSAPRLQREDQDGCPICRLKEEIPARPARPPGRRAGVASGHGTLDEPPGRRDPAGEPGRGPARYAWLIIAVLALATLLVWWAAFR